MPIPISTTTVEVRRRVDTGDQDPWDDPTESWATISTGTRAVIALASGQEVAPGRTEVITHTFISDPIDLDHADRIVDDYDGRIYDVVYVYTSPAIAGLSNTQAQLVATQGFRSNP